jgi:hypothetical protein
MPGLSASHRGSRILNAPEHHWRMMAAAPGKWRLHSRLMFHVIPAESVHIMSKVPELARAIRDSRNVGGRFAAAMDSMTRSSFCKSSYTKAQY